jgi:hypothetical protein
VNLDAAVVGVHPWLVPSEGGFFDRRPWDGAEVETGALFDRFFADVIGASAPPWTGPLGRFIEHRPAGRGIVAWVDISDQPARGLFHTLDRSDLRNPVLNPALRSAL